MSKQETKKRPRKTPSLALSLVPLIGLVFFLGIGYGKFRFPTQVCMIAAAAVTAVVAYICGLSWDDMMEGIKEKISASLPSIFVMICVGAMISSWMVSGTIPMLIYYGIKIIDPRLLFVTGFLVCALISTVTGTSFGSAGTAGIAVMGVAIATGAPLEIAAGAVISGAVFGDKLSPFSDTTILAPIAADCDLYDHIKHMFFTTGCASIVALIVYAIAGMNLNPEDMANEETVQAMLTSLESMYGFNPLLLLPPVIVLAGAFLRKPTVPTMLIASVLALIMGVVFHGFTWTDAANAFYGGFKVDYVPGVDVAAVPATIITLLNRGGLMGMMSTILLVFCAIAFGGIYSKTGCIEVVLNRMLSAIKSVGSLITSTVVATIFMSIVTGSSYLAILVPGELFRGAFDRFGLHHKNLSRTLEDAGTCVVPLVPWAVAGTYMASTLGVSTLDYLPWAVLCYTSFVFAIIFGFTGITIRDKDDRPIRKSRKETANAK